MRLLASARSYFAGGGAVISAALCDGTDIQFYYRSIIFIGDPGANAAP